MNNLEKWLISIEPEKVIEEIQKRACSECPAAEYCKNSPLNFCTEVLYAWAKEEALIEGVNMVAGDELIIDTEHMTVTLNGANIIDRVSDDSAFFKLQPGENDIIVEGGTTADVKILWKDRWL